MVARTITVTNRLGIHARAAGLLVQLSKSYQSQIIIEKNGSRADTQSILEILMLGAEQGSELVVTARGDDATEALDAVQDLISVGFHEKS